MIPESLASAISCIVLLLNEIVDNEERAHERVGRGQEFITLSFLKTSKYRDLVGH